MIFYCFYKFLLNLDNFKMGKENERQNFLNSLCLFCYHFKFRTLHLLLVAEGVQDALWRSTSRIKC